MDANSQCRNAGAYRKTANLSPGAQLFVFSIRQWLLAATNQNCVHCELLPFYERHDAQAALPVLCELMCQLSVTARRPVEISCPCSPDLTDDESVLLVTLQFVQRGDHRGATQSLRSLLADCFDTTFVRIASAYVAELQSSDLSLTGVRFLHSVPSVSAPKMH